MVFLIVTSIFLFSSCRNNPDKVVEKFSNHWFRGNLKEAKPYLTPESRKYADLLMKMKTPEELEQMQNTKVDISTINVIQENDSSRIYHCDITLNGTEEQMVLYLKKLNNRWFINITN